MSRFLSPKYLKYRGGSGRTIDADRPCPHCGYNLRGLKTGQSCPECGGADDEPAAPDVLLGSEPERARLRLGFGLATLCLAVALVARIAYFLTALVPAADLHGVYVLAGAANSAVWAVAVWLVTPPEIARRAHWLARPRRAARLLAPAFAAGYACLIARDLAPAGSRMETWLEAGNMIGRLLGGAGAMLLAFVLHVVAADVECVDASRRFNAVAWLLWFPTLLAQAFPASMSWLAIVPLAMVLFFWGWLMVLFILGMRELWSHVRWAGAIAVGLAGRASRMDETRRAMEAAVAAAIRPPPDLEGDVDLQEPRPPR